MIYVEMSLDHLAFEDQLLIKDFRYLTYITLVANCKNMFFMYSLRM
jgi:hypothetical protein